MTFFKNKKILLTGGNGFLGKHVHDYLIMCGAEYDNILIPRSCDYDLRKFKNCLSSTKNKDIVIHLAANVGGIGYNQQNPGSLFYDNAIMGIQMIEAARRNNVGKFVAIGTVCAYPKMSNTPFKEDYIWDGYPEETNAPYGLAKKMMLVQSQAYREQYNFNSIYLIPVNLYGAGDNFNPNSSHVIPALIKKFHDAKMNGDKSVTLWGTGNATREFLHVDDAARAIVTATEHYNGIEPVNLGACEEISIKDLANIIKDVVGYGGEILWDASKPDGQPRRCLDISRAYNEFGFKSDINLKDGLYYTYEWYKNMLRESYNFK